MGNHRLLEHQVHGGETVALGVVSLANCGRNPFSFESLDHCCSSVTSAESRAAFKFSLVAGGEDLANGEPSAKLPRAFAVMFGT